MSFHGRLIRIAAAAALVTVLAAPIARAQSTAAPAPAPDFSQVEIKTTDLGHNTWMLEGQGGNITIAAAGNGVFMIDSEFAPLHDKIKAAIAAVTRQPVRYLVNTHFHGDHTGGNAAFAAEGVGIAAHENVRVRLAAGTVNGLTGAATPPAPPQALPEKTYGKSMTLKLRGRTMVLQHIVHAHTDGDTYVYFRDADVLSTGDIFSTGRYPNIDYANGGSIDGMIAGANTFLKIAGAGTRIVPGHGHLASRDDLAAYRDMLVAARERMARLIAEGKSEDDVIAARPFADFDARLGVNDQAAQNFMRVVFRSLKQK